MSELVPRSQSLQTVQSLLDKMKPQFQLVLAQSIAPERFVRVCLTQIRRIPKLAECTPESLLGAFMECAALNLEPGINGQAWILPYKKEATFVLGFKGMLDLAWRSDKVAAVFADCVYDGDVFDWQRGDSPYITHKPMGENDPAKITHAYAVIHTTARGKLMEVLTRDVIEKIRKRAPSAKAATSPWKTDYAAMAMKTALRRVCKLGPASVELRRAIELDDMADVGTAQRLGDTIDVPFSSESGNGQDESPNEPAPPPPTEPDAKPDKQDPPVAFDDTEPPTEDPNVCPGCDRHLEFIKDFGHAEGCEAGG